MAAGLGCGARREARRVASHTSGLQQRNAPKTGESNVQIIFEQALTQGIEPPKAPDEKSNSDFASMMNLLLFIHVMSNTNDSHTEYSCLIHIGFINFVRYILTMCVVLTK